MESSGSWGFRSHLGSVMDPSELQFSDLKKKKKKNGKTY